NTESDRVCVSGAPDTRATASRPAYSEGVKNLREAWEGQIRDILGQEPGGELCQGKIAQGGQTRAGPSNTAAQSCMWSQVLGLVPHPQTTHQPEAYSHQRPHTTL
uniref:Uncharacterized protein n=1 Tax=Gopherus agassizii TaxID=38772 RepID=A0A452I291_9SAUR